MEYMGIAVYFVVILAGILFGLFMGLALLAAIQRRQEKKRYRATIQEAMGYEDDVKKIQAKREKEEDKRKKREEKRLRKEQEKEEKAALKEQLDESESDASGTNGKDEKFSLFGKKKEQEESMLESRINRQESYSEMLCDGKDEEKNEIIHEKLLTQDEKYGFNGRKNGKKRKDDE